MTQQIINHLSLTSRCPWTLRKYPETSNNAVKRVNCDLEIYIMSQFEVWEQNKFKEFNAKGETIR